MKAVKTLTMVVVSLLFAGPLYALDYGFGAGLIEGDPAAEIHAELGIHEIHVRPFRLQSYVPEGEPGRFELTTEAFRLFTPYERASLYLGGGAGIEGITVDRTRPLGVLLAGLRVLPDPKIDLFFEGRLTFREHESPSGGAFAGLTYHPAYGPN